MIIYNNTFINTFLLKYKTISFCLRNMSFQKKYFFPLCGLILFILLTLSLNAFSQNENCPLAEQYYKSGDVDKAVIAFEECFKKNDEILQNVYPSYFESLIKTKSYEKAEKTLKKLTKKNPENLKYKVDQMYLFKLQNKQDDFEKVLAKTNKEILKTGTQSNEWAETLDKRGYTKDAIDFLLKSREVIHNTYAYGELLIQFYAKQGKTDDVFAEILKGAQVGKSLNDVKNQLQNFSQDSLSLKKLRKLLIKDIQNNPDQIVLNDLMVWVYIQDMDFESAFIQAKAIDKRFHQQGTGVIELGNILLANKNYPLAIDAFTYIVNNYNDQNARLLLINAKEAYVKSIYPIDEKALRGLIKDYQQLCDQGRSKSNCLASRRAQGLIYGFYLSKIDTAETLLQECISNGRYDQNFLDQTKIYLADLYILKGEPWESTLLYMQVQLTQAENFLGHEAKFKDARLHFYNGDFQLAEDQLDVLKLATTREISNDAIKLSLLIQDNLAADSTAMPLRDYANTDLLIFQNKISAAIEKLSYMQNRYAANKIIIPQIQLTLAQLYRKKGDFQLAVNTLETLLKMYPEAVQADEALYLQAEILEYHLKSKEKALAAYQELLKTYPSSFYSAEARKHFRNLRGDKTE